MVRNLGHIHTMKYYTVIKIMLMESFNDGDFIIYINWERIQNCVYMYWDLSCDKMNTHAHTHEKEIRPHV